MKQAVRQQEDQQQEEQKQVPVSLPATNDVLSQIDEAQAAQATDQVVSVCRLCGYSQCAHDERVDVPLSEMVGADGSRQHRHPGTHEGETEIDRTPAYG